MIQLRNATNIKIQKAIVHSPNTEDGSRALSQAPLTFNHDDPVYKYLASHIEKSLADRSLSAAKFDALGPNYPSGYCNGILDSTVDFVDGSVWLSEQMFDIIEADRRTKPGDLVICIYTADQHEETPCLALLKIDPSSVFRREVENKEGVQIVKYVLLPSALTREKLQKCAFVAPIADGASTSYDMMLLDKTTTGGAKYFAQGFLKAKNAYDARDMTSMMLKEMRTIKNNVRDVVSSEDMRSFELLVEGALNGTTIDLDDFSAQCERYSDEVQEIVQERFAKMPQQQVTIDPKFAESARKKVVFTGDSGLRVTVNYDARNRVIMSEQSEIRQSDGKRIYRIVLETEKWNEVK